MGSEMCIRDRGQGTYRRNSPGHYDKEVQPDDPSEPNSLRYDDGSGEWRFGSEVVRSVTENKKCPEDVDEWEHYDKGLPNPHWVPSNFLKVRCGE